MKNILSGCPKEQHTKSLIKHNKGFNADKADALPVKPIVMIEMNESTLEKEIKINFWRQHIVEGLLKAIKIADEIKEELKRNNGKAVLIEKYGFSPHQAQALMDLRKPIDEIDERPILSELRELKEIEEKLKLKRS